MDRKINIVFAGHVDHGKSTLIGRLLYDSENIPYARVSEIQKIADEYKKRFEFAYFIDSFDDELKEERTIDTTRVMFKSKKSLYTIIDVPGHKEFIKHMLTGASQADVAVLVVSATEGVREQTKRHAFLLNLLGIKELIVVINKMDEVDYKIDKFETLKSDIQKFLKNIGYKKIRFIPASAMEGENIYKKSEKMTWYNGQSLVEVLDDLKLVSRRKNLLRFVVQDNYNVDSEIITVGRVESGVLEKNQDVIFRPSDKKAKVTKIKIFDQELEEAKAGQCVGIVIDKDVNRGDVCGLLEEPPISVTKFVGEVVVLDTSLRKDDELELRCGTNKVKCKIDDITQRIDSETGEILDENVDKINENEAAKATFEVEPLVVEKFAEVPELGRFTLIRKNKNIGAGVVLEV